jgi:type III secretory pathway component EscS
MWLLYVFIISVIGVLVLLFSKISALKNNRQTFVCRLLAKADPLVSKSGRWIQGLFHHHSERAFFLFLVHLPNRAEAYSKHLKTKAHDYYRGANRKIRGKRDLSNNAAASPYMRSMHFRRGDNGGV